MEVGNEKYMQSILKDTIGKCLHLQNLYGAMTKALKTQRF
jgi:hypothetical protein